MTTFNTNPANADSDDDGLTDGYEVNTSSTDPTDADSDDDGLTDGYESIPLPPIQPMQTPMMMD